MPTYQIHVLDESTQKCDFAGETLVVPNSPYPYLMYTNESKASITAKFAETYQSQAPATLVAEMQAAGHDVSNAILYAIDVRLIYVDSYTGYNFPAVPVTVDTYQLQVEYILQFDSTSTFGIITTAFIKFLVEKILGAVVVLLIAFWVVQAIQAVVTSMVTRRTITRVCDAQGNCTETDVTEPDYIGILTLVAGGSIAAGAVYYIFFRPKKGEAE